jgi:hypothetical protein
METYRYVLEKSNKKHVCPECSKKTFVPYIDIQTGEHLPNNYGRCDRETNCSYHLNPYKDGYTKTLFETVHSCKPFRPVLRPKIPAKELSTIKLETLKQSRKDYSQNNFIQWLNSLFEKDVVINLISRYHIGTSKHWPGATVFWQIDRQGKIRTGKIMLYNPETGRRIKKEQRSLINWVHTVLKLENFNLQQCCFGEHLLNKYPSNPVGIVESEKTAIIASVYLPTLVWLAVGSLANLNINKCKVLAGRNVYLFPDLNAFDKWQHKALELSKQMPGTLFKVSDLLQNSANETDKLSGADLADYLIRYDSSQFIERIKHSSVVN